MAEARERLDRTASTSPAMPDIDLQADAQLELLRTYARMYADIPFPETKSPDCRYYFDQPAFRYSDAIYLHCFLRHFQPPRIVEVGSGLSSAVILDTIDRFLPEPPRVTFIEPETERLRSILRPGDTEHCDLLEMRVQDAPAGIFPALEAGSLLFIDSSHVVKCGSDLQFLLFDVLPKLPPGVFVHFHDIFFPFEYPAGWVTRGFYWNEAYFLRAFLSGNRSWRIRLFAHYAATAFHSFLEQAMPRCLLDPGGSLYLESLP